MPRPSRLGSIVRASTTTCDKRTSTTVCGVGVHWLPHCESGFCCGAAGPANDWRSRLRAQVGQARAHSVVADGPARRDLEIVTYRVAQSINALLSRLGRPKVEVMFEL